MYTIKKNKNWMTRIRSLLNFIIVVFLINISYVNSSENKDIISIGMKMQK